MLPKLLLPACTNGFGRTISIPVLTNVEERLSEMASSRKRKLIVDGFNVLRSGSRYRDIIGPLPDWDHDAFNRAREALINDVACYAGREWQATIVFDGGGNEESTGEALSIGGVRIVFSPKGMSADSVVEKLAYEAHAGGFEALVVSSDASIQDVVFAMGIERMSADGFSRELNRYDEETKLDDVSHVAEKRTIAGRIDPDTLTKLKSLRDNL